MPSSLTLTAQGPGACSGRQPGPGRAAGGWPGCRPSGMFPESYMTSSPNKQSSWGPLGGGDCTQKPPAQTKVEEPAQPGSTIDGELGVRSQPSAGQMKKQLAAPSGPLSSRMGVLRELPVCPCPHGAPRAGQFRPGKKGSLWGPHGMERRTGPAPLSLGSGGPEGRPGAGRRGQRCPHPSLTGRW